MHLVSILLRNQRELRRRKPNKSVVDQFAEQSDMTGESGARMCADETATGESTPPLAITAWR